MSRTNYYSCWFSGDPPPKEFTEEWHVLNSSDSDYSVQLVGDQLNVKVSAVKSGRTEFKLSRGTLIGINRGEFGGSLFFSPADTKKKTIKIKDGNIKSIFRYREKIYFIEGIAHMGISRNGFLYIGACAALLRHVQ